MLYIVSLGGSIVAPPNGINIIFLKKFKKLIENQVKLGNSFIIVVGGGNLARSYAKSAIKIDKNISIKSRDQIGIYATFLNAYLLKSLFSDLAYDNLLMNPNKKINSNKSLFFSGGYKPGNSSDFVAVLLAKTYNSPVIINLSNIDYVYDKDPYKFNDAKKIKQSNWKNFLKIIGDKWEPGMNAPFDPVASSYAQKNKKKVVILNGENIKNLESYFSGQKYKGTEIFD